MNEIENDNIDKDYAYSRDTYYELIEKSKQSLDLMLEVARESEHPRAFEVLGNLINKISETSGHLGIAGGQNLDLSYERKKVSKKKNKDMKTVT